MSILFTINFLVVVLGVIAAGYLQYRLIGNYELTKFDFFLGIAAIIGVTVAVFTMPWVHQTC